MIKTKETEQQLEGQMSIEEMTMERFFIDKPVRLIELFAGVGAQAMALRDVGMNFEHWRVVEFDKYPVKSYNAIHGTAVEPTDIQNIHAADLSIEDTDRYCYVMTYSFPCQDLSTAGKQHRKAVPNADISTDAEAGERNK